MHNYNYPESVNGMPIDGEKDSFSHKQKYGLQGDEMESMAVIGFSTRFPQDATSSEAFWEMLREGRSAMTEVPKDRFNVEAFYHPNPRRMNSVGVQCLWAIFDLMLMGLYRSTPKAAIISKIPLLSMLHFFLLRRQKLRVWIRNNADFWKRRIKLSRMVTIRSDEVLTFRT